MFFRVWNEGWIHPLFIISYWLEQVILPSWKYLEISIVKNVDFVLYDRIDLGR